MLRGFLLMIRNVLAYTRNFFSSLSMHDLHLIFNQLPRGKGMRMDGKKKKKNVNMGSKLAC